MSAGLQPIAVPELLRPGLGVRTSCPVAPKYLCLSLPPISASAALHDSRADPNLRQGIRSETAQI